MKFADRVKETSTTEGTGAITVDGAEEGFQSFLDGIGDAEETIYCVAHRSEDEWEVIRGTYTDSSNELSRDETLSSSAGGSAVSFSAGTKDVFVVIPADRVPEWDGKADDPHGNEAHDSAFATESALNAHEAGIAQHDDVDDTDAAENDSWIRNASGIWVRKPYASQAEAEAGTAEDRWMSPLRVKQAIDALAGGGDGNWELVATEDITTDVAEVELSGLSSDNRYRLYLELMGDDGSAGAAPNELRLRVNDDSSAIYDYLVARLFSNSGGINEVSDIGSSYIELSDRLTESLPVRGWVEVSQVGSGDVYLTWMLFGVLSSAITASWGSGFVDDPGGVSSIQLIADGGNWKDGFVRLFEAVE